MNEQNLTTQTMKISDVKARLSRLVNAVYRKETRVLVEKAGIPVAALVSVRDLERLVQLEREKAARRTALEAISAVFEDVPTSELENRVSHIIAEVRAERDWAAGTAALEAFGAAFQDVPASELEERIAQIIAEGRERDEVERKRQPA